jgi:hypothetical protein
MARLKGLDEDCVAVAVVGQHDVLVAAAGAGGKAAHVVSVEFADGFDPYVEFV